jgi:hypothetical protein
MNIVVHHEIAQHDDFRHCHKSIAIHHQAPGLEELCVTGSGNRGPRFGYIRIKGCE